VNSLTPNRNITRPREEILISDVARQADTRRLNSNNPNAWHPIPYTTESFAGVMLACGVGPDPRPITVKLHATGWYRVWVALFSFCHAGKVRLRLSGETCAQLVASPAAAQADTHGESVYIHETHWRDADLTEQTLIVEPSFSTEAISPCAIAYLRLEPIDPPAATVPREVRHPMAMTNDGHGIFSERPHFRPDDLLESFERIPEHTSLRLLLWGLGCGDMCNYPTQVGNYFPTHGRFATADNRTLYGNMKRWQRQGWDSLRVIRDYARRRKWELQTYLRMEAFDAPYPFDETSLHSEFFHRHPEYHCFDNHGQRVMRLSYAYPPVQAHMLALIREIAGYQPDGISLGFIRGVPLVLYEQPMVEGFQARHGIDPRELAETDPRWMAYQADVLTPFVRQAKACLAPGQRLSVIVPGTELDCRRWGLDVATWVSEGIVDDVLPTGQSFTMNDVHCDDPQHLDFDYFNRLPGRERIRLIPMLYPWTLFERDYPAWRDLLHAYLDHGADMYAVWDATPNGDGSNFTKSDIGYADREAITPPPPRVGRRIKLTTLDGFRCDRYQYYEVV